MSEEEASNRPKLPFYNLFLNAGVLNGDNSLRAYVLTIAITILCYVLAPLVSMIHIVVILYNKYGSIRHVLSNPDLLTNGDLSGIDRNIILLGILPIFLITLGALMLGLKYIHHKAFGSLLSGYEKFRFPRFWTAFWFWGGLVMVLFIAQLLFFNDDVTKANEAMKVAYRDSNGNTHWLGIIISTVLLAIFLPIQTLFEEVFFRGYLLQGFSQVFHSGWLPALLTSILFGLAHADNPEVKEYGFWMMIPYYTSFALFFALLTLLDEGIELALGIHLANNFFGSIFVTSSDSVIKSYSLFTVDSSNPAAEMVVWFVCALITFIFFRQKFGLKDWRRVMG